MKLDYKNIFLKKSDHLLANFKSIKLESLLKQTMDRDQEI